jgi:hypothetical protein
VVDFALSRMLGLYVVARLAQRYNIKVQLRHSWYGGITALVLLPPTVAVRAPMPEAIEAPKRGPAELVASTKPAEPAADETGEHLPIFEAARSDWFEDSVRGDHLPLRRHAAQQPNGRAAEPTGNGAGTLGGAGATRAPGPGGPGPGGSFGFTTPRPDGQPEPSRAEAARADEARAEALRAEAMRVETARMEAAQQAEAARGEAPPGPTARTGRARPDGTGARTGPLPTRTPGASGPPPGGAKPFAPAPPPGGREAAVPPPARSGRRADRGGADRIAGTRPAAPPTQPTGPAPAPAPESPAPAAATLQAASVQTTKAGLPRRVPRANLAPGMVAAHTAATAATAASPTAASTSQPSPSAARSPEEVRSMLSSYRSGLERGRMMAAGEDADRGGDAHSSSRSDDDATQ